MAKTERSFFGSLFKVSLLALAIGVSYGYYKGYRLEDAEGFLREVIAEYSESSDTVETDETPTPKVDPIVPKANETVVEKEEVFELLPLPSNPYASIDARARSCPNSAEESIESLAAYLQEGASTDLEKARSIYVWLTDNVSYDDDAYNSGDYNDYSSNSVLLNKLAVCEGFSNLFQALGEEMGLNIMKISGYSKGYGYQAGASFTESNHAWNIIKIEGNWRVFDATWGQGSGSNVKGKLVSKKGFDPYWFNVDPYEAVFNHLPKEFSAAKVNPSIDLTTYEELPYVQGLYFKLGFNGDQAYKDALKMKRLKFPEIASVATHIEIKEAPAYRLLKKGNAYKFSLHIPRAYEVVLKDAKGKWNRMKRVDGLFQMDYIPEASGKLSVMVKHESGGSSYWTCLTYEVKDGVS